jgi:anti-sigma regulatory factor (Ser/Thr protein kinase)
MDGNGPARTLELVDRFARSLDEEAMATAAYAVVDLEEGVIRFASAGHLPPVLIRPGGEARTLDLTPSPPLGAFGYTPCTEHEFTLGSGDTLLLYTDGLIERPRVSLSESIAALARAVEGARGAEEACLMAVDRLVPRLGARDDVALIAFQLEPAPEVLELELAARPAVLARLRQAVGHWLRAQDLEREVVTQIMIAVSEAGANAIEHAYGPGRGKFRVHAARIGEVIEVRVSDQGRWRLPRGEHRGRGLAIMQAAMDQLEVRATDGGTEIVMRRNAGAR